MIRFGGWLTLPYDMDKDIPAVAARGVMEQEELRYWRLQLIAWLRTALHEALGEEAECYG